MHVWEGSDVYEIGDRTWPIPRFGFWVGLMFFEGGNIEVVEMFIKKLSGEG